MEALFKVNGSIFDDRLFTFWSPFLNFFASLFYSIRHTYKNQEKEKIAVTTFHNRSHFLNQEKTKKKSPTTTPASHSPLILFNKLYNPLQKYISLIKEGYRVFLSGSGEWSESESVSGCGWGSVYILFMRYYKWVRCKLGGGSGLYLFKVVA